MYYCRLLETFLILGQLTANAFYDVFFSENGLDRHSHKLSFWISILSGGSIYGGRTSLFLAVLTLCCFVGASSSPMLRATLVLGCWFPHAVPSVVVKHSSGHTGFRWLWAHVFGCSCSLWHLLRLWTKPVSPASQILIHCATREVILRCLWKEGNCEGRKVCKLRCLNSS